jgi:hypothetical protein
MGQNLIKIVTISLTPCLIHFFWHSQFPAYEEYAGQEQSPSQDPYYGSYDPYNPTSGEQPYYDKSHPATRNGFHEAELRPEIKRSICYRTLYKIHGHNYFFKKNYDH